jgi:hypothetical protein
MARILYLLLLLISAGSCRNSSKDQSPMNQPMDFDPSLLRSDMSPIKKIRGQLLYLPVYSNMPYQIDTVKIDMSAFIAIHNTDLISRICLTKVLYFNQNGKLVDDFLNKGNITIEPLATKDFYIPYEDQSGTGANFLVEWVADTLVNEPLFEAITICLKPNNSVAVLSQGKILSEKR